MYLCIYLRMCVLHYSQLFVINQSLQTQRLNLKYITDTVNILVMTVSLYLILTVWQHKITKITSEKLSTWPLQAKMIIRVFHDCHNYTANQSGVNKNWRRNVNPRPCREKRLNLLQSGMPVKWNHPNSPGLFQHQSIIQYKRRRGEKRTL